MTGLMPDFIDRFLSQTLTTLAALAVVFVGGWALTDFLGGIYKDNIQAEAQGDLNLLVARLSGETATVEAMVKALSGSHAVLSLLTGDSRAPPAQTVLGRNVDASGRSWTRRDQSLRRPMTAN